MAQFANMFEVDLNNRSYPVSLVQTVSDGNVYSNRIGAYVYKNGAPVNLGGACTGLVMRADGTTVPLTGYVEGNAAYVVLDQPSCAIPGPIQVAVNSVVGENITTLLVAYGTVILTDTRNYVEPGTPIPDITELLAEIDNMREATAAAEAAATKSVRYDTTQSLTDNQKSTARSNIDAADVNTVVRYDAAQSLTDAQETTARDNIGAASILIVSNKETAIKNEKDYLYQKDQVVTGEGRILASTGEIVDVPSSTGFEYVTIPVAPGDTLFFTTNNTSGGAGRGYAIYTANNEYITGASTPGVNSYELVMPENAAMFRIGSAVAYWTDESKLFYIVYGKSNYKKYAQDNAFIKRGFYDGDLSLATAAGTYYLGENCTGQPSGISSVENMTLAVFAGSAKYGHYSHQFLLTNDDLAIYHRLVHSNTHEVFVNWTNLIQGDSDLSAYTWNAVGDSITHQGLYMNFVRDATYITVVNCGLSSSTIAINNTYLQDQSIVERVCGLNGRTAYADADIWTVMGGLNDVLYRSTLGQIEDTGSTFDNTTVYGALQSICEHIMGLRARPRLILMTPTQSVRDDWSKATYGITIAEIRKAIMDVGEYYAIPVLDVWALSGINHYNMQKETNPTTVDGVHPNSTGARMLAQPVADAFVAQF